MRNNFTNSVKRYKNHIYNLLRYRLTKNELSPVRFIIFGRGRSGSTALVSLLNSLQNVYCDGEILNQPVIFPFSHVLAKCANSGANIYGCKILSYQIKSVQPIANRKNFIGRLYKRGFKIIYLKRENLVYHALSNIRARVYGFHKKFSDQSRPEKLTVDLNDLLRWIIVSENLNQYENLLLNDIPYLPLTYEKDLAFEESHRSTVELICSFLGIENATVECEFCKVSPRTLRDGVANYDELIEHLKDTPYAKYLD